MLVRLSIGMKFLALSFTALICRYDLNHRHSKTTRTWVIIKHGEWCTRVVSFIVMMIWKIGLQFHPLQPLCLCFSPLSGRFEIFFFFPWLEHIFRRDLIWALWYYNCQAVVASVFLVRELKLKGGYIESYVHFSSTFLYS